MHICVLVAPQISPRSSGTLLNQSRWRRDIRSTLIKADVSRPWTAAHLSRIAGAWHIAIRLRSVLRYLPQNVPTDCNSKCMIKNNEWGRTEVFPSTDVLAKTYSSCRPLQDQRKLEFHLVTVVHKWPYIWKASYSANRFDTL